jgi:predicted SprT family Zn-dependent metalloprotease
VISLSHENRFFFENPFIVPTAENKIEITHPRNIHPPTMSNDHQVDIKSEAVKKRFESDFLPKYEILWRAMRNTSKNSKTRTPIRTRAPLEAINFIQAINKKATVSFSIDRGHGGECGYGCAPPFLDEKISKTSNQRVLIDLVDSSSSDDDSENKNETICLLSDSEDEYQSLETYEAQKTRVPAYDELSSDESSFELEFDYGYDENNSKINEIDDLIESTNKKKPLHDGKENLTRRKNRLYVSKSAFQKRRRALTTELFAEFNRKAFGGQLESVEVIWSTKLRTTAGQTRLKRQYTDMRPGNPVKRLATIELSTKVLTDQERLEATLLHEMVHAAAWIVDSVSKPPHGRCFWKWANCAMENVSCIPITTTHTYEIQYKYAWVRKRRFQVL